MKKYSIGQFAKIINRSQQTLRNWDNSGKLKPEYVDPKSGYRYYTDKQLKEYNGEVNKDNKIVVGYCRVSSSKQKEALERQIENVRTYLISKGYQFKIITDTGSGINYDKKGLNELIQLILQNQISKVVVLYKDRLVRFGYELIKNICDCKNVEIEIIDNTEKTEEEEVVEDLIQIITVFSCRLQGKRANKTRKMIKELTEDDTSD
ncbi:IS607 family transposase [Alkaliphilus hydrothermalis]|uniref:Site-specific integrase-resolvase n=1 Tax=Alkaliphilus hydrothermalis TaxID=1482730 RepID=A0ABS2NNG9_9FIRM|nr:IS607 family transposase [Alkaliphilus hydrothermalis]MBM7614490.1 putative site-specific integrase-resolvase [Alkaliphilus hydrothermalis]